MFQGIPFSGRIREARLPTILRSLQREQRSGTLRLQRNDLDKALYLKEGDIIFASSKYPDDRLGEVLLKSGKITFSQYESSVLLLKKTGKRQGTILVEQGFLTPQELFAAVTLQVKEIVQGLFTWIEGDYHFLSGPLPTEEVITLTMSTADLILGGIRRISDWTRLASDLPPFESRLRLTTDPRNLFQAINLNPQEAALGSKLEGRSIREVLTQTDLPPFEALKLIYFSLSVGVIEAGDALPVDEEEKEPVTERIIVRDLKETIFHKDASPPLDFSQIQNIYKRMQQQSFYEILEVGSNSSREEIKRSYFRLVKVYHPDRHFEEGLREVKKELEGIFSKLSEGYDTLTNREKRRAYDAELSRPKASPAKPPNEEEQARQHYYQGKGAYSLNEYKTAVYFFESATRLAPENHVYWGKLGEALLYLPGQVHRAEAAFRQAVSLKPEGIDYYVSLAKIYEGEGLVRRALKEYESALKIAPQDPMLKEHLLGLKKRVS